MKRRINVKLEEWERETVANHEKKSHPRACFATFQQMLVIEVYHTVNLCLSSQDHLLSSARVHAFTNYHCNKTR